MTVVLHRALWPNGLVKWPTCDRVTKTTTQFLVWIAESVHSACAGSLRPPDESEHAHDNFAPYGRATKSASTALGLGGLGNHCSIL